MRHPKPHAATIDFFPGLEAAAIGPGNIKCHRVAEKFPRKKHPAEIFPWACTPIGQSADQSGNDAAHAAICCPQRELRLPTVVLTFPAEKTLGLTLPPSLLARADEVIE